jgi:hypothetical protein
VATSSRPRYHSRNGGTLDGDQIGEITAFRNPELLERFGLPDKL